jgi:protoporphyrinogen oxidase
VRIGIIGAGVTGLTAGWELARQGHTVRIFESEKTAGGLVSATTVNGVRVEDFYHHIFTVDREAVDLIHALGMEKSLEWLEPSNGIYINGKLYPFTTPMDLLRFRELPFFDRIAMGLLLFKARLVRDYSKIEGVNAKDWIVKKAGQGVYDKVWGPLIASKFDADEEKIGSVWIWNKFVLRGSSRTKGVSGEMLGYMRGSFMVLCERLEAAVKSLAGQVSCGKRIDTIEPLPDGSLRLKGEWVDENFDRVIATTPPAVFTGMVKDLPAEYRAGLDAIRYKADICMLLEVKKPVAPYYWITVAEREAPFVLMLEHTNLIRDGRYKNSLVYLSRYCDASNPLYTESDENLFRTFTGYMKKMFPAFDENQVIKYQVRRARYAQPVIGTNYSKVMPEIRTPVPNLYLACMAQIYPEDRGMNYAVRLGKSAAARVLGDSGAVNERKEKGNAGA